MTFNVRGAFSEDGPNAWPRRRSLAIRVVRCANPDLIAFQEANLLNLEDFDRALEAYWEAAFAFKEMGFSRSKERVGKKIFGKSFRQLQHASVIGHGNA